MHENSKPNSTLISRSFLINKSNVSAITLGIRAMGNSDCRYCEARHDDALQREFGFDYRVSSFILQY